MEREKRIIKLNTLLFVGLLLITFSCIFIFNHLTPYMSDDFEFQLYPRDSLYAVISTAWDKYMKWNGRLIPQAFMIWGLSIPKQLFNIINSLLFILLLLLIYCNILGKRRNDVKVLLITIISVWIFVIDPGQTLLWVSGSCNYLWAMVVILSYITLVHFLSLNKLDNNSTWLSLLLSTLTFIVGMLAGWCNENTSGGAFLMTVYYIVSSAISKTHEENEMHEKKTMSAFEVIKNIPSWGYTGTIGMAWGIVMMVKSPGAKLRLSENLSDEAQTGISAYVGRLLKLNNYVRKDFCIIGIIVIFFLVIYVHRLVENNNNNDCIEALCIDKKVMDSLAYIVSAILTTYVLLFTTTPMNRALFGAGIYLIIAMIQLSECIGDDILWIRSFKSTLVIIGIICFVYQFMDDGVDLVRIRRELNEREYFVDIQTEEGNQHIVLPMIREDWDNRFTFIYHNDITPTKGGWGNMIYEKLYGVEEIIGVTYDEWETNYMDIYAE